MSPRNPAGRRPDVQVHIGEIVLRGVPVNDPDGLADAVRAHLAELVTERGLPDRSTPGGTAHGQPTVQRTGDEALAAGIADAVWQRLGVRT